MWKILVVEDLPAYVERFQEVVAKPLEERARFSYAADLEERLREWWLEELTIEDAATELGVNYDAMRKRLANGSTTNAGRKGAPRVRRCDLYGDVDSGGDPHSGGPSLVAEVFDAAS